MLQIALNRAKIYDYHQGDRGRLMRKISAAILTIMFLLPILAASNAMAFDQVNRTTSLTFYTSDGGTDSGHNLVVGGYNYPSTNNVQAFANIPWSNPFGETGWAYVWHTVEVTQSGAYVATLNGHYWIVGSIASAGVGDIYVYFKIQDSDTMQVNALLTIAHQHLGGVGAFSVQNDFTGSNTYLGFSGIAGHHYHVGLYVEAYAWTALGTVLMDALGDQGAYFTSGSVAWEQGGCVSGTTEILKSDGSVIQASDLCIGDRIVGYNYGTQRFISETVTNVKESTVSMELVFNNGMLVVTPTDQPTYARNSTYTGWVRDPVNITVGWQVYCPILHHWIEINSVTLIQGTFEVYDISTNKLNDFIGNGVLLDAKTS
jgi:hypothetical protein